MAAAGGQEEGRISDARSDAAEIWRGRERCARGGARGRWGRKAPKRKKQAGCTEERAGRGLGSRLAGKEGGAGSEAAEPRRDLGRSDRGSGASAALLEALGSLAAALWAPGEGMVTHFSFLAWDTPRTEEPGGL